MIGASRHKSKNTDTIPTIKLVACPSCDETRLCKYVNEDGSVDAAMTESVEVREKTRYLDVCGICVAKYRREDEVFVANNMQKLADAFKSGITDKDTTHKDFSLN
jgi:hypothetical protein